MEAIFRQPSNGSAAGPLFLPKKESPKMKQSKVDSIKLLLPCIPSPFLSFYPGYFYMTFLFLGYCLPTLPFFNGRKNIDKYQCQYFHLRKIIFIFRRRRLLHAISGKTVGWRIVCCNWRTAWWRRDCCWWSTNTGWRRDCCWRTSAGRRTNWRTLHITVQQGSIFLLKV